MTDPDDLTAIVVGGSQYPENPYMKMLIGSLRDRGTTVLTPEIPFLFPLTRIALGNRDADVIQLDWVYGYYITDETGVGPLDAALTAVRTITFLLDLLIVSLLPVSIVRTVHNKHHHEQKYRRTERIVNELLFWIADAVTVKCHAAAEIIADAYRVPEAETLDVIPDGNYIPAYENRVSREQARAELSIPEDAFVYLFFGLVREYKGIPELIDAFGRLEAPNAELWIVGNPHTDELERELSAMASETGSVETVFEFVPDGRIQYYMNAADAFVLPYRSILNSGSAYLGLSYGVPIIAPTIGCLPESLPPENEFLYDPTERNALGRELKRAYDHPSLESIGRENYEYAVEQDWGTTAEAIARVYARTVDRSRSSPVIEG